MSQARYGRAGLAPRDERGSAFILVLLAILIITFLGLGLAVMTETEMQLGANEQIVSQSYYTAETGLHAAYAALLTTQDWSGERLLIVERELPNTTLGVRTSTDPMALTNIAPAPWSNANEGEQRHYSLFVTTTSTSQRVGWPTTVTTATLMQEDETDPIVATDEGPTRFDDTNSQVTVQSQATVSAGILVSPQTLPDQIAQIFED